MKLFKNILVVWNQMSESMEAVKRAVEMARKSDGRVTVLQVIPSFASISGQVNPTALGLRLRILYEARFELKRRIDSLGQEGILMKTKVVAGVPATAVIAETIRNRYDLVVVTADEGSELLSNMTMQLLRECPSAVWIFKPRSNKQRLKKILVPLDLDPFDTDKAALDRRIMDFAVSLAESDKAELHIVHAWNLGGFMYTYLSEHDVKRLSLQIKMSRYNQLDVIFKELGLKRNRYRIHLREGEAKHVIPQVAADQHVDLVVMGTVSRTGIAGFVVGNTVEKILTEVPCSVLALKREGFAAHVEEPERFEVPDKAATGLVDVAMSA